MRKIKWCISCNFARGTREDEFEVDDEATEEEINEMVLQAVLDSIDWGWQEETERDSK